MEEVSRPQGMKHATAAAVPQDGGAGAAGGGRAGGRGPCEETPWLGFWHLFLPQTPASGQNSSTLPARVRERRPPQTTERSCGDTTLGELFKEARAFLLGKTPLIGAAVTVGVLLLQ
ncbi:protein of unknown function [Azospirillum lipoferum 4B]|uniref:Uncharacterized protein n=1 Tax=Azospirillum lipoferum (strain 4B) TaxID=862719 RepID=G7Z244_AZOL4|nr:protein of unknown function [Azospirillum lipoferum 4B]